MSGPITAREETYWMAYYKKEGFGEYKADLRAGIISSTMHSMWSKRPRAPVHFMPLWKPRETVDQQMVSVFKGLVGKTFKDGKRVDVTKLDVRRGQKL